MDSVRTEDQKKADESLEAAINDCMRVYGMPDDGEVISDFVVLCATNTLHKDGVVQTNYPILLAGGDIPWYRILGLLETHLTLAKSNLLERRDNG